MSARPILTDIALLFGLVLATVGLCAAMGAIL